MLNVKIAKSQGCRNCKGRRSVAGLDDYVNVVNEYETASARTASSQLLLALQRLPERRSDSAAVHCTTSTTPGASDMRIDTGFQQIFEYYKSIRVRLK